MGNGTINNGLLRLIGFMAICVGVMWALQILGFGHTTAYSRFLWVMGAALVAGAGTGLIAASGLLTETEGPALKA